MGYIHQEMFPDLDLGDFSPVRIMGVMNLSPESFYSNSFINSDNLVSQFQTFIGNGATIIDLGARSTAPWSDPITLDEEFNRVQSAITILQPHLSDEIVISIDTQYGKVAKMALEFGKAHNIPIMINDVSCFSTDSELLDCVVEYNCPVCIMASEKVPGDTKTIREIMEAFDKTIKILRDRNYTGKIILDPGIGKWTKDKTYEFDLAIIDGLNNFRAFGCPILVGLSRKSFIGEVLNEKNPNDREIGSYAATSIAVYNGAHIIRTHDVNKTMLQTIQIASAIRHKPIRYVEDNQICEYLDPFVHTIGAYHCLKNQYDVTAAGSRIMKNKMVNRYIVLKNITAPQALILKQEMLARGGDVALDGSVITTEWEKYDEKHDVILIGTIRQLELLVEKLAGQDLKLDLLGKMIQKTISMIEDTPKVFQKDFSDWKSCR